MFYRKAIAISVTAALILTSGCSSIGKDDAIVVPQGETVSNGDITIINGANIDVPPTEEEKITINIGLYNGAAALSAGHLLESSETGVSYENYSSKVYNNADDVVTALENGEVDVATMPIDAASKLYIKSNGKYQMVMINSLFNYCIAQNGDTIAEITDLADKTITVAENDKMGKIVIDKLIKDYGINNCTIETVADTQAIINGLADGSIKLALTQEPYISEASAKNANVTMGLDLYDSWFDKNDADIVTGCLVANSNFIDFNGKAFIYFLKDYDASVTITRKNIDESSQLAEKYGLTTNASAAKTAIPGCGILVVKDDKMVNIADKCLNLINSIDPIVIGGKAPDSNFYYKTNN